MRTSKHKARKLSCFTSKEQDGKWWGRGGITFFFWCRNLNSGPTPWATPQALFCDVLFRNKVLQINCLGWLLTAILLISASWGARITGTSHRCPPTFFLLHTDMLFVVCGAESRTQGLKHARYSTTELHPCPHLDLYDLCTNKKLEQNCVSGRGRGRNYNPTAY
jgi:hypothetical protein